MAEEGSTENVTVSGEWLSQTLVKCRLQINNGGRFSIRRKSVGNAGNHETIDLFLPCQKIVEITSDKIVYESVYCRQLETRKLISRKITITHERRPDQGEHIWEFDVPKKSEKEDIAYTIEILGSMNHHKSSEWFFKTSDEAWQDYDGFNILDLERPSRSPRARQNWIIDQMNDIDFKTGDGVVFHAKQATTLNLLEDTCSDKTTYVGPDDVSNLVSTIRQGDPKSITELNVRFADGYDQAAGRESFDRILRKAGLIVKADLHPHENPFKGEQSLIVDTYTASEWVQKMRDEIEKRYDALTNDGHWVLVNPAENSGFHAGLRKEEQRNFRLIADEYFVEAAITRIGMSGGTRYQKRKMKKVPKPHHSPEATGAYSEEVVEGNQVCTPVTNRREFLSCIRSKNAQDKAPDLGNININTPTASILRNRIKEVLRGDIGNNVIVLHGPSGWGKTTTLGLGLFSPKNELSHEMGEFDEVLFGTCDEILAKVESGVRREDVVFIVDDLDRQKNKDGLKSHEFIERVSTKCGLLLVTMADIPDECKDIVVSILCKRPPRADRQNIITTRVATQCNTLTYVKFKVKYDDEDKEEQKERFKDAATTYGTRILDNGGNIRQLAQYLEAAARLLEDWWAEDGDSEEPDYEQVFEKIMSENPMAVFR
jgi:hypothetical protein